jgi:8-oxo-dGTP pyrophosphatase MutT (NUDIX family)
MNRNLARGTSTMSPRPPGLAVASCKALSALPLCSFGFTDSEPGESAAQAATRECFEETGLPVRVEHEIGRRAHPVTGRHVIYLAGTPTTATAVRTPPSKELVELRWLDRDQVEDLMPDLHHSVRR